MNLTKLQVEIIQYRLDVPDAMAEVLAESQRMTYEQAIELVEKYAPNLIYKLQADLPLYPAEVEMIRDIATDECYLACCESDIEDPRSEMTQRRYTQIERSYQNLRNKLSREVVVW